MSLNSNRLEFAKKNIERKRKGAIGWCCVWLFLSFLWFVFGMLSGKIITRLIALLPITICFFEYKCVRKKDDLLKQISNLKFRRCYEVKLTSPRIAFMNLGGGKYTPSSYGIMLFDKAGKTYYYFFDDILFFDTVSVKTIHKKFSKGLTLQCYENTEIVSSVENDPFYICVKNGNLIKR